MSTFGIVMGTEIWLATVKLPGNEMGSELRDCVAGMLSKTTAGIVNCRSVCFAVQVKPYGVATIRRRAEDKRIAVHHDVASGVASGPGN